MGCSSSKSVTTLGGIFDAKGDPKSRCALMMKEATLLHTKVKAVVRDAHAFQTAADKTLESIKQVLATPLPKVYDTDAAAAEALMNPTVATVAGDSYSVEAANKAKEQFSHSAAPRAMETWMQKYDEALARQKALNKAFDELSSARDRVAKARSKEEALRRSGLGGEDAKVVEAARVVSGLQDKLNVATENHKHEEEAQYGRLVSLIGEAGNIAPAMRQRLGEMSAALDAVKDTVPAEGSAPAPPAASAAPAPAAPAAPAAAPAPPPSEPAVMKV